MINTFMIHKHQTTPGDSERRNQGSDLLFVMMLKLAGGGRKRNTENPRHIPEERKNKTSSERWEDADAADTRQQMRANCVCTFIFVRTRESFWENVLFFKKRGHFLFGQRRHVEECEQCLVLRAAGCPQTVCDTSAAWINVVVLQVGVAGSSYVTHMLLSSAVRENKTVSWSWVRAELTGDDSLYLHYTSFKAHFLFSFICSVDFI